MEPITFEQLPQAVSRLQEQLNNIEQLILRGTTPTVDTDELLTISQAAKFLNLSIPTIYCKVYARFFCLVGLVAVFLSIF